MLKIFLNVGFSKKAAFKNLERQKSPPLTREQNIAYSVEAGIKKLKLNS